MTTTLTPTLNSAPVDVEITDVRLIGLPPARMQVFSLDAPAKGGSSCGQILRLGGWAMGTGTPITGILVFCQGALLRVSALDIKRPDVTAEFGQPGPCGFSIALSLLELPREFELSLYAVFGDHERIPMATVSGRHRWKPPHHAGLQPLLLTSLGRTGTTHLMSLLAHHPAIAVDRTHPFEANAAAYWMHMLRVMTRGETTETVTEPFDRGDWLQPPFRPMPITSTPSLQNYLETDYPALAANFCRDAIDAFYRRIAGSQGQPAPACFSEKILPGGLCILFNTLYAKPREIFLVRDFRDVLCSILAFNKKRGTTLFGRDQAASDEQFIPQFKVAVRGLLDNYQARRKTAHLVYYEDVILRPKQTLRAILQYAGLNASDNTLQTMLEGSAKDDPNLREHRTTPSPEASIGRWKKDLDPALQKIAQAALDPLLLTFGYSLDKTGNLIPGEPEPKT